jgi:hypothetical protein
VLELLPGHVRTLSVLGLVLLNIEGLAKQPELLCWFSACKNLTMPAKCKFACDLSICSLANRGTLSVCSWAPSKKKKGYELPCHYYEPSANTLARRHQTRLTLRCECGAAGILLFFYTVQNKLQIFSSSNSEQCCILLLQNNIHWPPDGTRLHMLQQ